MMKITVEVNGTVFPPIESATTKIVRCIKRQRGGTPPEGGWPVITDQDIYQYVGMAIIPSGDSWHNQMVQEDNRIRLDEIERTPDDMAGAKERADARIAELNDPNK